MHCLDNTNPVPIDDMQQLTSPASCTTPQLHSNAPTRIFSPPPKPPLTVASILNDAKPSIITTHDEADEAAHKAIHGRIKLPQISRKKEENSTQGLPENCWFPTPRFHDGDSRRAWALHHHMASYKYGEEQRRLDTPDSRT